MVDFGVTPDMIREAAYGLTIPAGDAADAQIQALIDKAATRLASRLPSLQRRIDAGTLDIEVVQGVVEDMVLRVMRNPRALRSIGLDDFQETVDTSTSTGLLYVSADELALLRPARTRRVGSIRLGVPAWRLPRGAC